MSYVGLGSRFNIAAKDATGMNAGNYTNAFTSGVLGINVANYELYHIVVSNVPAGAQATLYIGARQWGFTNPNGGSEWDPAQPMLLNPSEEVYFFWNLASTGAVKPQVTCWFRYDPALPGNH